MDGVSGHITTQLNFFMKKWGGRMAKTEERFLIINLKHLEKVPTFPRIWFNALLDEIMKYIPGNKYYACNQDEPYAQKLLTLY